MSLTQPLSESPLQLYFGQHHFLLGKTANKTQHVIKDAWCMLITTIHFITVISNRIPKHSTGAFV